MPVALRQRAVLNQGCRASAPAHSRSLRADTHPPAAFRVYRAASMHPARADTHPRSRRQTCSFRCARAAAVPSARLPPEKPAPSHSARAARRAAACRRRLPWLTQSARLPLRKAKQSDQPDNGGVSPPIPRGACRTAARSERACFPRRVRAREQSARPPPPAAGRILQITTHTAMHRPIPFPPA